MTTLNASFERDLEAALLDDVERQLRDDIGPALKRVARENWEAYASRNDYDIDHIWTDAEGPFVDRSGNSVSVRIEWPGLTALFEFGVSPHTIRGNPVLHFYWEAIGEWVTTESVEWGSRTGGIPESRAIRRALNEIQREIRT